MRIGIFGGSFNPFHVGHLAVAEAVWAAHDLDRLLFVPARIPPHKREVTLVDAEERFEMVALATAGRPGFEVSRLEMDRDGPSFTVDTLRSLGERYPGSELLLIVGADNFRDMGAWREALQVFLLSRVVVVDRPQQSPLEEPAIVGLGAEVLGRCARDRVEMEPVPVSSTQVRDRVAAGESIAGLVPPEVAARIESRGLYGRRS